MINNYAINVSTLGKVVDAIIVSARVVNAKIWIVWRQKFFSVLSVRDKTDVAMAHQYLSFTTNPVVKFM